MDVPWQNLFSEVEMEQYGDLFNNEYTNSMDSGDMVLEEILKQFAFSSESERYRPQTQSNSATPSCGNGSTKVATQKPSKAVNHIMAERKRRQQLSQRFIALSAIIPGLNKTDKVSIVKETINYVKDLKNRVRELEEHGHGLNMSKISSYTDKGTKCGGVAVPEIEARVLQNDVLIRIHCNKNKGFSIKILRLITSLGFSVVKTSVLPFGNCALHITIIAQIGDTCKLTVKELVNTLRRVLLESPVAQQ